MTMRITRPCQALAFIVGLPAIVHAGATVTIQNAPATLTPGQTLSINTFYQKTADEPEKRVILRVDMHNAATHQKVAGAIADNGNQGYKQNNAFISTNISVPAGASGAYYFKATLAPWSMNKAVVTQMESYPTDGTFSYLWGGGGFGVTQNVYYKGTLIAPKPSGDTTYCSGLAFETAVIPFNQYNATYGHSSIGNILTSGNMSAFRIRWYGASSPAEKLAAQAIPEWGVGVEITDWEEAQEGDFVQLWRHSSSGHNPLFVSWRRNSSGTITGCNYWGSQPGTNGIGYAGENFGTSSAMNRDRFYIGRMRKPRDQADYDWAIGQTSTAATPSVVNTAVPDWAEY